jgi:uncharacterized membrane protein
MVEFFDQFNPYLATVIAAMVPVTEVNGAIPLAIGVYGLNPVVACLLGTLGTLFVVVIVLPLLHWLTKWARSWHPKLDAWIGHFFSLTYHKHSAGFERWGSFALFVFVAIPGPFTGVWTASLLAYLFGIRLSNALIFLGLGSLVASTLVTLTTLGVINLAGL